MASTSLLTSGQLARASGLNRETLRFYERRKLLPKPGRTLGGYRLFPAATVERLRFIQGAKALGFSLAEIQDLLGLESEDTRPCSHVAAKARTKLADIDRRIETLQAMRLELSQLIARCGGRTARSRCGPECIQEARP